MVVNLSRTEAALEKEEATCTQFDGCRPTDGSVAVRFGEKMCVAAHSSSWILVQLLRKSL